MPLVLQDNQIDTWLDPTVSDPQQLGELLKPPSEDFLDWLAGTTAPRAADRGPNHQDSSFAPTGLTELLILSGSLAAAAGAILRCEPREFGRGHGFSGS